MSWVELIDNETIYPTLVIPIGADGSINHAFCVVDDLIFDSTQTHALKLTMKSIEWICGEMGVADSPYAVYRFCNSNQKGKVYRRKETKLNW